MVIVEYFPGSYRLRVRGHAGSGEPGRDLVCAGVSALVLTLRENLLAMHSAGAVELRVLAAELGAAQFWCDPAAGSEERLKTVFETVVTGLRLLEKLFGEYISVEQGE